MSHCYDYLPMMSYIRPIPYQNRNLLLDIKQDDFLKLLFIHSYIIIYSRNYNTVVVVVFVSVVMSLQTF